MTDLIETIARAIDPHAVWCDDPMMDPLWAEHHDACRREAEKQARAALTAIEAAGYRVVPLEPTEAMVDTAHDRARGHATNKELIRLFYGWLLSAAPKVTP